MSQVTCSGFKFYIYSILYRRDDKAKNTQGLEIGLTAEEIQDAYQSALEPDQVYECLGSPVKKRYAQAMRPKLQDQELKK